MNISDYKMLVSLPLPQYEIFDYSHIPTLTKMIFALFMILVPILLLNMLIAMMGNTYATVIAMSSKEWRKQMAEVQITDL